MFYKKPKKISKKVYKRKYPETKFMELEPFADKFTESEKEEFDKEIYSALDDKALDAFVWDYKYQKPVEEIMLNDAMHHEEKALRIVIDCFHQTKNTRDDTNINQYVEFLGSKFRHDMAAIYRSLSSKQKASINSDANEVANVLFSEILASAIINHALVRYYLANHIENLKIVYSLMNNNDKFAVAKYCLDLRDVLNKHHVEIPSYVLPSNENEEDMLNHFVPVKTTK